ncbi:class I SAM-dependent methyltransferase [Niallia taxi]|uniref:class I SAM-dependent methyltransferase n=1 Tax=Niallia taxi TaxID=2499688 RepID=UPI001643187B|nr:class I SAM-dependent methyltransferase [Niallia taxi]MDE5053719.1 class I SAM-dependent methyltransferase [Niallia taxi]MED3964253.1 class I SAM-dependent methyltransferase [Niallia taxi]
MKPSYQDALAYYGVNGAHPGGLSLTRYLLQQEKITSATSLLDAGCGTGQTSAFIKKHYPCSVTSIDLHPTMVKRAASRFHRENLPINLVQGSIEKLPFPDGSFDIILVESVLIFTDIRHSLKELKRVLKPNGVVLALEMTSERELTSLEQNNMRSVYGIEKVYSEGEWVHNLAAAGFRNVEIKLSHTVYSHMFANIEEEEEEMDVHVTRNLEMENKLTEHAHILYTYGNIIGYRVYRATL